MQQHDSGTGVYTSVCVCVFTTHTTTFARLFSCLPVRRGALSKISATFGKVKVIQDSPCVCLHVCVRERNCRGWGCCHFGNTTAHIAAITTAEKCFSATCNYYRLQIAVLASEALARKGETLCICVHMCLCVCVVTHK